MADALLAVVAGAGGLLVGTALAWGSSLARLGTLRRRISEVRAAADAERERALKELEVAAKHELLELQRASDKKLEDARADIAAAKKRLDAREIEADERRATLDAREESQRQRERALDKAEARQKELLASLEARQRELEAELSRIARLDRDAARAELLESVMDEARLEAGRRILALEASAEAEAMDRAAVLISTAAHRIAASFVAEKTVTVVPLPSDDMKGRIIGREGRNIRALEAATGVDVIVDDTPEVVVLSGFSPLRREVARVALTRLIEDGRVHPARIEEVVDAVRDELDGALVADGEELARELGVSELPPALHRMLGGLRFHVVAGQNLRAHAVEVVSLACMMAEELEVDAVVTGRIALLRVLGAVADHELGGSTAEAAVELARKHAESAAVVGALRSLAERAPDTVAAVLVDTAFSMSRARPGARRESAQTYIERHEAMEAIGLSFDGVTEAHAIRAGRELRVMVSVSKVDDARALILSRDIAARIREELTFPGEVRVTVVRESRATEVAR